MSLSKQKYSRHFQKKHRNKDASLSCFSLEKTKEEPTKHQLTTGYFVGVDWIEKKKIALHVAPKFNKEGEEIDLVSMLFSCLKHPRISTEVKELFLVDWNEPSIEIEQKQDLLTPFLAVEFLSILKKMVKKGLKKSYYSVERNLQNRIKGKVLIAKNLKRNVLQNKRLHTYCRFEEFGLDNLENRLLKKALVFIQKYLSNYTQLSPNNELQELFNYTNPAFQMVSDKVELNEIKQHKTSAFYKEYQQAIHLAKMILKRFGYNLSNTAQKKIKTAPFWIDMSKLFELYVLEQLIARFPKQKELIYQASINSYSPDYLLKSSDGLYQMVIDAKYKKYATRAVSIEDIRQVSGYARMSGVYQLLEKEEKENIDCLIIYPDNKSPEDLSSVHLTDKKYELKNYLNIFKIGIKVPTIL
jgi:5-methylcytosine-specific restriction enzyme subunit McrC